MKCHARLTKWTTRSVIGEGKHYALQAYVCTGTVQEGLLCLACSNRSRTHTKNVLRLHGLLTEPIPDTSHIYGGSWYWRQVESHGEPPAEWIAEAAARQVQAEKWVEGGWSCPLSSPTEQAKPGERTEDREMGKQKAKAKQKAKPKLAAELTPLTQLFPPKLPLLYEETNKPVKKMETDEWTLLKGEYKGIPVWILPNGKQFDMDEKGEPRNLIG